MVKDKYYTIQQIADIAGIPKITMYKFITSGPYIGTVGKRNAKIYSETVVNDEKNNYLSEYIESLESQITQLTQTVNNKTTELEQSQENLATAQKLIDQAQQLQLDLQNRLNHTEQERLSLLSKNEQLTEKVSHVDDKEKTIAELEAEIAIAKEEKEDLERQLSSKSSYNSYLDSKNIDLKKKGQLTEATTRC